jgi:carboxymethylenebutenolidase
MTEEKVEIRTSKGTSDGFLYRPETGGPYPGIIHFTDIGGIRPAQREMARRLADKGYAVLLPNVFYRTAKPPLFDSPVKHGDERTKRLAELSAPLTPEAMAGDASAYVDFLGDHAAVRQSALGVVGYCFTGKMAFYAAAARPEKIAAAASFHGGGLATDAANSPHLVLPAIKARLYFGHATSDRSMPEESIEKLKVALRSWGGLSESEVYEGAFHSWTVPDSPVYNHAQAERAFAKLAELFAQTLG